MAAIMDQRFPVGFGAEVPVVKKSIVETQRLRVPSRG